MFWKENDRRKKYFDKLIYKFFLEFFEFQSVITTSNLNFILRIFICIEYIKVREISLDGITHFSLK